MEEVIKSLIKENMRLQLKVKENYSNKRFLFEKLNKIIKNHNFFLGITGLRGIGKTTLLLQLCIENQGVYFSADSRNLKGFSIYEIVNELINKGYKKIFIDEIHLKQNWDLDLKNIYDTHEDVKIYFTGSSALELKTLKADLARRVLLEKLPPASFREWLLIKKNISIPIISFEEIIEKKVELTEKYWEVNEYLEEYYQMGGVLYSNENYDEFYKTIISIIETIIIKDLSPYKGYDPEIDNIVFSILNTIAISKPMELSYEKLGKITYKNKVWIMRFMELLDKTELIIRITAKGEGMKTTKKEYKYYLPFPYRYCLCTHRNIKPNIGSLREEFFVNHVEICNYIKTKDTETSDFIYKNKKFEVGGINKKKKDEDYRVIEGIETNDNRIPLFLFGLIY
jgi:uncharacterized protein